MRQTDYADESWIASQGWRLGSWLFREPSHEELLDLSFVLYDDIWRELAER